MLQHCSLLLSVSIIISLSVNPLRARCCLITPKSARVSFPKTSIQLCKPGINIGITALTLPSDSYLSIQISPAGQINKPFSLSSLVSFPGLHVIFSFWSPIRASSSVFHYVSYSWKFWRVIDFIFCRMTINLGLFDGSSHD